MAAWIKIKSGFWNNARVLALSPHARNLFLALLTHPQLTALGAIRTSLPALAFELGLTQASVKKAFAELENMDMARREQTIPLIWLPSYMSHNSPDTPNAATALARETRALPRCPLLRLALRAAAQSLAARGKQLANAFAEALAAEGLEDLSETDASLPQGEPAHEANPPASPGQSHAPCHTPCPPATHAACHDQRHDASHAACQPRARVKELKINKNIKLKNINNINNNSGSSPAEVSSRVEALPVAETAPEERLAPPPAPEPAALSLPERYASLQEGRPPHVAMRLPLGSGVYAISWEEVEYWREVYSDIDIMAELAQACLWLLSRPDPRCHDENDAGRFLASWLGNAARAAARAPSMWEAQREELGRLHAELAARLGRMETSGHAGHAGQAGLDSREDGGPHGHDEPANRHESAGLDAAAGADEDVGRGGNLEVRRGAPGMAAAGSCLGWLREARAC